MAENIIQFYATSSDKLDAIAVKDGNLIFTEDDRALYLDARGKRTSYQQIICLQSEEQRTALPVPVKGFYFILDTYILWRYDENGWHPVTTTPQEQIVFGEYESFPEMGNPNRLYIDGTRIYRYLNGNYQLMSASFDWGEFN